VAAERSFSRTKVLNQVGTYSGFELDGAVFEQCTLAQFEHPLETVVRDASLTRCKATGKCFIHGVKFENVTVQDFAADELVDLAACVFRNVVLEGAIGPFITTRAHPSLGGERREEITQLMVEYYRAVDWALDISRGEFQDATLPMVPGHLVRRNPETQFLVKREPLEAYPHEELPLIGKSYRRRFSTSPFDSLVVVAPTRSDAFGKIQAQLSEMRELGLAE